MCLCVRDDGGSFFLTEAAAEELAARTYALTVCIDRRVCVWCLLRLRGFSRCDCVGGCSGAVTALPDAFVDTGTGVPGTVGAALLSLPSRPFIVVSFWHCVDAVEGGGDGTKMRAAITALRHALRHPLTDANDDGSTKAYEKMTASMKVSVRVTVVSGC